MMLGMQHTGRWTSGGQREVATVGLRLCAVCGDFVLKGMKRFLGTSLLNVEKQRRSIIEPEGVS